MRHKHEFWYSSKANKTIDGDVQIRKEDINSFLEEAHLPFSEIGSVLDYGGDKGQHFIDRFDHAQKYLYDISNRMVIPSVHKINDYELSRRKFHMIMLYKILEHVSAPQEFMKNIRSHLSEGGYVHIVVPYDRFHIWQWTSRSQCLYLENLLKIRPVFKLVEYINMIFRLRFCVILPFIGLIKLHEHINFFTIESLKVLLDSSNFEVIRIRVATTRNPLVGQVKELRCLARIA